MCWTTNWHICRKLADTLVVRWLTFLSYISGMSANALACILADCFNGLEWLLNPLEEQKYTQMIDLLPTGWPSWNLWFEKDILWFPTDKCKNAVGENYCISDYNWNIGFKIYTQSGLNILNPTICMHFVSCTSHDIFFRTIELKMTAISAKVHHFCNVVFWSSRG